MCLSIFLDAIQRFVEPQIVTSPVLVLIVGCFGLLSNILGLFLFHDHGHSHGSTGDRTMAAEEGHSHEIQHGHEQHSNPTRLGSPQKPYLATDEDESTAAGTSQGSASPRKSSPDHRQHIRHSSGSRFLSIGDDIIHPASFRKGIIDASRMDDIESADATESENEGAVDDEATETSPLVRKGQSQEQRKSNSHEHGHDSSHSGHRHTKAKAAGKEGHSHGDLNMRGVFLHVMGDALGNLGVIGSALFIWLTPFWWRYYSDPLVSLVITVIILTSAIPLCKAAARILLQAVPAGIDVGDIRNDINRLPGIIDCHHVHVWQLSDTKLVSSLHIEVSFDFKGEGSARYMQLARAVRACLHGYGIHSSTIQPEFNLDAAKESEHGGVHGQEPPSNSRSSPGSKAVSAAGSVRGDVACLLQCGDECADGSQCCAPGLAEEETHSGPSR